MRAAGLCVGPGSLCSRHDPLSASLRVRVVRSCTLSPIISEHFLNRVVNRAFFGWPWFPESPFTQPRCSRHALAKICTVFALHNFDHELGEYGAAIGSPAYVLRNTFRATTY